jgi:hypothetical protein
MKRPFGALRFLILVTVGAALLGAGIACATNSFMENRAPPLRAVHYWGDGYPKTFWNSIDPSQIDRDFTRIQSDGFNAIVLAVSWSEFQPRLTPTPAFDERSFALLQELVQKAKAHHLDVILRVGFIWSFRPDVQMPNAERIDALFVDDAVRDAWLAFVAEICSRVCAQPNLRFGFLSWEDLFPFNIATAAPNVSNAGFRRRFIDYLRGRFSLADLDVRFDRHFADWNAVTIPERRSPAYALVFDYWDDALIKRFWLPARQRFPRLSFEVRVDRDPIWNGDTIAWYGHDAMLRVPGVDPVVLYYSVAWGMLNVGDEIDAGAALASLDRMLAWATQWTGKASVFIDQFNFFDNTPEFSRNTRLRESQMDPMLVGSAEVLAKYRAGYALWSDHDYAANVLYNPSFQVGLEGWATTARVTLQRNGNGRQQVRLGRGASISQATGTVNREPGFVPGATGTLCIRGRSVGAAGTLLRVTGIPGSQLEVRLAPKSNEKCIGVRLASSYQFSAPDGAVYISDVKLFTRVQESRIYRADGAPGPQLAAIRTLNRKLERYAGSNP